jgi:uncharacterized protein (DUF983 family)
VTAKDSRPAAGRMLGRALARRCPVCGRAPMFDGWLRLRGRCGVCGFSFERDEEDDYWLTEVIFAGLLLAALMATWPSPPWTRLIWIGALQMIVTSVAFYPFSKALWLAGDLVFRPSTAADFPDRSQGAPSGQSSEP